MAGTEPAYFALSQKAKGREVWIRPRADIMAVGIYRLPGDVRCLKNLGCIGQWCKVDYRGIEGWVEKDDLSASHSCDGAERSEAPLAKSCDRIGAIAKYFEGEKVCICPFGRRWNADRTRCVETSHP
jgi:hypothetical protein